MDKLLKQLQRDLKRNPKKAGILGLLVLVAGWFWLPLIMPKEEPKRVKPTAAATTATAAPVAAAAPAAAATMRWQDLARALDSDPRMRSLVMTSDLVRRNPFTAQVAEFDADAAFDLYVDEALAELDDEERTISPEEASPQLNALPLVLSSTIVGGRTPRAVINGRAYDRGATIGLKNELPIVLTVIEVRRVIVEWNGSRRELRILRPGEQPTASLGTAPLLQ
jgi:hypothetical protein